MEYLFLSIGLLLLLFSGKYLVNGSVSLANHFRISKLVVGVTIVSFGTSAPELFVSTAAALDGFDKIAIGNIIGSNIANIGLVLAITAIILPIPVRSNAVKLDAPFMLFVTLLFYIFIRSGNLSRINGLLFLLILVAYSTYIIVKSRKHHKEVAVSAEKPAYAIWLSLLLVAGACVGLKFGSDLLVVNASKIASSLGVDDRVISITVVAFGTSLPELVTSIMAALRKEMDISIGNIIGSNFFNILAVMGVTSVIKPLEVAEQFYKVDMLWVLGLSLALFVLILPFKGGVLTRAKGLFLFLIYCAYLFFLIRT